VIDFYDELDIPDEEPATAVSHAQGLALHDLVTGHGLTRTLEIGLGYGVSAAYIMAATRSRHIAIDPYQDYYGNRALANLRRLGFESRLEHIAETSQLALPRLVAAGESADFVFIDGGHKLEEVFVDWYFSDLLVEQGGLIVLDDVVLRPIAIVGAFVRANRPDYEELEPPDSNFLVFKKIGRDERDWDDFSEFE
jgi:predicted O-methyltransferase YrrM